MDHRLPRFVAATILAMTPCFALAGPAQAYPTKPIRIIVSSPPGTPPDAVARIVAEPLAAALGKPVIVDNRPGGSGTIGLSATIRSAPDGHTLGYVGLPQIVAPSMMDVPYDLTRDVVPVTKLTLTANVLVVRASSPLQTVAEFVAMAKAKPGALTYASAGNATPSHLASELFKRRAEIDIQHVPYKGIAAGLAALMGEQVDIAFAGAATALPLVNSGKLRALASAGAQRLPAFPNLPTIAELGFAGFQLNEFHGVVAPAGTAPEVIATLADELARILESPNTKARLASLALYPANDVGPEPLAALIKLEVPRWRQVVRQAGIRAD